MDNLPELQTIRRGSASIINSGTTGQMLMYVLDRFGPHESLIRSRLGFGTLEACRTIRIIQLRLSTILEPVLEGKTEESIGFVGPRHYRSRLDAPTKEFIDAWKLGTDFEEDDLESLKGLGLDKSVVTFLTAPRQALLSVGASFGRWAFIRKGNGGYHLVIPWALADTITSAVHMGLLEGLSMKETGAYGLLRGKVFEKMVARKFTTAYRDVSVKVRAKSPGQVGDTDLLVDMAGHTRILVQCKGRLLRPIGKWFREEMFVSDLERNIIEAASQAKRALETQGEKINAYSVFIVLDAYFAGASAFSFAGGSIARSLENLPRPVILTYYDLDYLLRRLGEDELRTYLDWRMNVMRSRRFLLHDEMDVIWLYLNAGAQVLKNVEKRQVNVAVIGRDPVFYSETIHALDERIFPNGLPDGETT